MTEKSLVTKITAYLRTHGYLVIKIHGSNMQRAGLPDLLAIALGGAAHWFEVKKPGEKPTKLQSHTLALLQQHGCRATVVTSVADVQRVLEATLTTGANLSHDTH